MIAPIVGKLTDRVHPRILTSFGMVTMGASLVLLSVTMTPDVALWKLLVPLALLGVGSRSSGRC